MGKKIPCRHCTKRVVARPRGLCWGCYERPDVKALYPISDSRHAFRGLDVQPPTSKPLPTDAPPGSLAKMKVLRKRLEMREELFHPADATDVVQELLDPFHGQVRRLNGGWSAASGLPSGLDDEGLEPAPPRPPTEPREPAVHNLTSDRKCLCGKPLWGWSGQKYCGVPCRKKVWNKPKPVEI